MITKAKTILIYICNTLCVVATFAMVFNCLVKYHLDEDVSFIEFKTFNSEESYIYPTITLCFEAKFLENSLKHNVNKTNVSNYSSFLVGWYWQDDLVNIDYDDITTNIEKYFLGSYISNFYTSYGYWEYLFNPNNFTELTPPKSYPWYHFFPHSYVTYRDSNEKCFSIDIPNNLGIKINRYEILFNTSIFPGGKRPESENFGIKIHYPNQFLSSRMSRYSWKPHNEDMNITMNFRIQNIVVSNMRNKNGRQCNENWTEDDQNKRKNMMAEVGCKPPHWKENSSQPNCSNKDQMSELAWKSVEDQIPPCQSIHKVLYEFEELDLIRDEWFELPENRNDRYLKIAIEFNDSSFMVIKQIQAFNLESLIGNSGGYLGLFTGYAFIQLPNLFDLIGRISKEAVRRFKRKLEICVE